MTDCPACGLPAEITDRVLLDSTDGPVEHGRVTCVLGCHFFMSLEGLSDDHAG